MTEKFYLTIAIGLIGIALTISRRWKNSDTGAGLGCAGWTIFLMLLVHC